MSASSSSAAPPRASALLAQYEQSWRTISGTNAELCERSRDVASSVRETAACCHAATAGWDKLQRELECLPSTRAAISELSQRTLSACAQIDALEQRLLEASVARVQVSEGRWRYERLAEAEAAAAQRRAASDEEARRVQRMAEEEACRSLRDAEAAAQRSRREAEAEARRARQAADSATREAERAHAERDRERQRIFHEQFEAQRQQYLDSAAAGSAVAPAERLLVPARSATSGVGMLAARSLTLAEVAPVGAGDASLDDFYDDE